MMDRMCSEEVRCAFDPHPVLLPKGEGIQLAREVPSIERRCLADKVA
jgi:hypothetical protein